MTGARAGLALTAVVTASLWCGVGLAQTYRDNMPAVLSPADEAPSADETALERADILSDFAAAYRKQNEPKLAVFWNRVFSDRLSQWIASERLIVTEKLSAKAEVLERREPRSLEIEASGASAGYRQVSAPEARRPGLGTLADAEFEGGVHEPLLEAGVVLIDRAAIMRLTEANMGRRAGAERVPDAQVIETEALKGYADYIAEIVMLPDAEAPHDQAFRVVVKHVASGRVVANFVTRGEEPSTSGGWRAGPHGYVREAETPLGAGDVGRKLAYDMMSALHRAWR